MKRPTSAPAIAGAALLVTTSLWVGLQALLCAANGRQSYATAARALANRPGAQFPETGASYWWPLVLAGAASMAALSVLALILVMSGRRRSWVFLTLPLFVHPQAGNLVLSWLRPIGFGWAGPWVQDGIPAGQPIPSNVELYTPRAVGTAVDLLFVAIPALVFLLLTRRNAKPRVLPALQVMRRLALPLAVVAFATIGYGLVNLNGGTSARSIPALAVPIVAGLLATTRLGVLLASAVVTCCTLLASPAVGNIVYGLNNGGLQDVVWTSVAGYALPLAALAATGALVAAHGPAIAAAYRRLVRRPRPIAAGAPAIG